MRLEAKTADARSCPVEAPQRAACRIFKGSERRYQEAAAEALFVEGRNPATWSWITTTCGTRNCVEEEHLYVHAPMRLAYPHGICIYCGRHAGTRDHLEPRNWTGDARRMFVVTVPACGTCNSLLNDTITSSITERRALAHARIRKHYRKVLQTVEFGPSDLAEFGDTLREYIVHEMQRKEEVLRMLDWPQDLSFDMRAIQQSGIDDPFVLGLILADDDMQMMARVRAVA